MHSSSWGRVEHFSFFKLRASRVLLILFTPATLVQMHSSSLQVVVAFYLVFLVLPPLSILAAFARKRSTSWGRVLSFVKLRASHVLLILFTPATFAQKRSLSLLQLLVVVVASLFAIVLVLLALSVPRYAAQTDSISLLEQQVQATFVLLGAFEVILSVWGYFQVRYLKVVATGFR